MLVPMLLDLVAEGESTALRAGEMLEDDVVVRADYCCVDMLIFTCMCISQRCSVALEVRAEHGSLSLGLTLQLFEPTAAELKVHFTLLHAFNSLPLLQTCYSIACVH